MNVMIKENRTNESKDVKFPLKQLKNTFAKKKLNYPILHWTERPSLCVLSSSLAFPENSPSTVSLS